jgi:hypothetical protein
MDDVWLTGGPHLAFMVMDTELPCLADQMDVFTGPIGVNFFEEGFDAFVDGLLIYGVLCRVAQLCVRLSRLDRGRALHLCRFELPDSRHSSL